MDKRAANDLSNHTTGHYGEDQFQAGDDDYRHYLVILEVEKLAAEEEKRILSEMQKIGATPKTHRLVYKEGRFVGFAEL